MKLTISDEKFIFNQNVFDVIYIHNKTKPEIFYLCKRCKETFTSKFGAKGHKCPCCYTFQNFDIADIPPKSAPIPIIQKNVENFDLAIEKLIRFVCVSNIPLRALDNIYFRQFLHILNENFDFPQRKTMADRIIQFACVFKNKIYEKLANKKISLLFDSAKKWSKNYQAIICCTHDELFLLSLKVTDNSKTESIKPIIIEIIQNFQRHNSTVISVCTDNDNTNKSVFDSEKGEIQKGTNDFFIRQPCSAHIANLALEDMFIHSPDYKYIYENIHKILLSVNPHNL